MASKISNNTADHPQHGPRVSVPLMAMILQNPRFAIPYFSHEPLNPQLYPGDIGKPVAAIPENSQLQKYFEREARGVVEPDSESDDQEAIEQNIDVSLRQAGKSTSLKRTISDVQGEDCTDQTDPFRLVTSKKIRAYDDMDEEDDLLYHLKLAKWTEKEIHARFMEEGRTNYNQKTFGTRFTRMRRAQAEVMDKQLATGETDWHADDDVALWEAFEKANKKIEEMKKNLEVTRWKFVAEHIRDRVPVAMYSGEACKKRFNELMEGTASTPLEHRPSPDANMIKQIQKRRAQLERVRSLERMRQPQ